MTFPKTWETYSCRVVCFLSGTDGTGNTLALLPARAPGKSARALSISGTGGSGNGALERRGSQQRTSLLPTRGRSLSVCSEADSSAVKRCQLFLFKAQSPSKLNLISTYQHVTNCALNQIARSRGSKTEPSDQGPRKEARSATTQMTSVAVF